MTFRSVFLTLAALAAGPALVAREEIVSPFEGHRVAIAVPDDYLVAAGRADNGVLTVRVNDPLHRIDLVMSFLPEAGGRLATDDGRRGFVADASRQYAEGSVELSYDFIELKPRVGAGLYCVFTDASLVRKLPLPPGEYLKVTSGVKAWPGVFVSFTLLSNDTTSAEYQAAMKILQESLEERQSPAKPPT